MQPPYDSWAKFYDLSEGDRSTHVDFYASLISERTRSLLELGCGTGVVTVALLRRMVAYHGASRKLRVTGLDESGEMLRIAQRRNPSIEWVRGSFCSPGLTAPYDIIICCFFALQNLLTESELAATFRETRKLLSRNGIFAFDVYRPNLADLAKTPAERLVRTVVNEQGEGCEVRDGWSYDPIGRVLTVDRRLMTARRPASPLAKLRIRLRQYLPEEIDALLTEAGLEVTQRFGDFDRSPFTDRSTKQIVLCTRAD